MLDFVKESLMKNELMNENMNLLSEMSDKSTSEDAILGGNALDQVMSPEEEKKIASLLDSIPEKLEDDVEITDKDVDMADKHVDNPTIKDLAESLILI